MLQKGSFGGSQGKVKEKKVTDSFATNDELSPCKSLLTHLLTWLVPLQKRENARQGALVEYKGCRAVITQVDVSRFALVLVETNTLHLHGV